MTDHQFKRRATDAGPPSVLSIIRTILSVSGPLGLMAIGLAAFLSWGVWNRLQKIEDNQDLILASINMANVRMSSFAATNTELERQRILLLEKQIRLLRQLCRNAAETDAQARECMAE